MKPNSTSNKSQTNFSKLDQLTDDEIDFSDLEEVTPDMFAKAVVRRGLKPIRKGVTFKLRAELLGNRCTLVSGKRNSAVPKK